MTVDFRSSGSGTLRLLTLGLGLALAVGRPIRVAAAGEGATSVADAVVHDLCGKRVALLGEPPMHGFGKTLAFKVEIARRLVDECHYNAFFIESGAYDFLNIQKSLKSGKTVTQPMITAAIGGLWATREVEPLVPFLLEMARNGALILGGLDDQLGRGTYAQQEMPADLVEHLQGDDKARCLAILQKHTLWQYTNEAPYGPKDKTLILGCLDETRSGLPLDGAEGGYERAMVDNLKRYFARDFQQELPPGVNPGSRGFNDRDRSMYTNFLWFMARSPAHTKVIVWTATTHASRNSSGVPGQEKFVPLGSYIHHDFKSDAFVLGFSAYSGTYAMARQAPRPLTEAPANSLEARAFDNTVSDVRYFNSSEIRMLGPIAARPFGPDFKTAHWGAVLDGLVIFREERPPQFPGK